MSAVPDVPCPSFHARGAGATTLVFLHGIGGDWSNFEPQLAAFADRYRAVAWTMPGYGDSPALPEMTFPALARAVVALLDRLDQDRVVLPLKKGWNSLLMKIENNFGGYAFFARVIDIEKTLTINPFKKELP